MNRSRLAPRLPAALACLAAAMAAPAAWAAYPERPIRFIVPQSPGGASDTVGRTVARSLTDRLGQQLVVDNRPGATGNIGHEIVKNATADGYTLLMGTPGTLTIMQYVQKNVPYNTPRSA